jgi:hypothetical protein
MHKLFLFPGAHKTGTTLLQYALESNRALLESNNFGLVERKSFYTSKLCEFMRNYSHNQKNDVSRSEAKESISRLCQDDINRNIIISIENIFGDFGHKPRMYHAAKTVLGEFQSLLPDHEIHVAFYVRRQDTFFESVFIQRVQKLHAEPFAGFCARRLDDDLRWTPILRDIQDVIGKDRLTVVPFESIRSGVDLFIKNMIAWVSPALVDEISLQQNFIADTNMSLSGKGIEMALSLFPGMDRRERALFLKFLRKNYSNKQHPKAVLLDDEKRNHILEKVRSDNNLLVKTYLSEYPIKNFYIE